MARVKFALVALFLAACSTSAPAPAPAPAPVVPQVSQYQQTIAPILAERCSGCHGAEKHKAKLALHTPEAIEAGSESGAVIVPGKPEESELVKRLKLPLAHDDHMPPKDRPQPSAEEIAALERWIAKGASFTAGAESKPQPLAAPAPVAARLAPADPKAIAALEQALVHVEKADPATELLWIDFAANAPKWSDAALAKALAPLAANTAELSLARTQAGPQTLALAAKMPNLERLDLRSSAVDDAALGKLSRHARLEQLVVAGAKLSDASVATLAALPALKRAYVWQSGITPQGLAQLASERPKLVVDAGDAAAPAPLEAEPAPKFSNELPIPGAAPAVAEALKPVNTCCPVSGAPLNPKYSIVFEGRVIGFCCNKCPVEFWADPEKFRAKLPAK